MAALGLGGYSSSDSEDQDTRVDFGASSRTVSLANEPIEQRAADAHVRATASEPVGNKSFGKFGRAQKRVKFTRRGLPLFSKPVEAGDESDSGDEEQRYKRKEASAAGKARLSFLPEPVRTLPIHHPEQAQPPANVASPSTVALPAETSEMYRVDVMPAVVPMSSRIPSSTPEALLSKSMKAGQHIEFKEIKADEIQQAAPHEKSEIDALRTAMGSEHAKKVQASAAQHMPSKRQKQRHQLSSLYHKSQMTEMQDMERKLTHTRSKAQTAAKYGW